MAVIIGVDPHKATHTAVAIDRAEVELARARVRATPHRYRSCCAWAEPLGERTWAIESAGGLGYLLSQQLVDAGETVVDVPATLASRIRVLGTGRSDKNDPNDALSVAVAALRAPALRQVVAADHAEVLRLLAKRNIDIGNHRTRVVCRLHNLLMELAPGGIAKELNASDAVALLERVEPATPVEAGPPRPGRRAARRRAAPRRPAQGVAPAHPHRGRRVGDDAHRPVRRRADHRLLPDRLHRRHQPVREPRPATPPTTAPPPSNCPPAAASCTASPSAGTGASTTPCTWPRSARSATPTPRAAPTSTARSPRARPRRKPSAP